MDFLATFLEGVATFVSPCLLPLLPLYLAYFAGGANEDRAGGAEGGKGRMLFRVLGFVCGFSAVFVALGALAGSLGSILTQYSTVVSVVCGFVVVLFGLHFAGLLHIPVLDRTLKPNADVRPRNFFASVLFGVVFALGWTPCVGVFLGTALALAASEASAGQGALLLLCYSLGLAIPFIVCAFAVDKLVGVIDFFKRHARAFNAVCGGLLVVFGLVMAISPLLPVDQPVSTVASSTASAGSASGSNAQSATAESSGGQWNNPQVADLTIADAEGNDTTLGALCNGKPMVINIWATWCPYCVAEMQDFQNLYDKYGDRVQFVMLNAADSAKEASNSRSYLAANKFTFPVFYDTSFQVQKSFSVAALPTTIVIAADGEVLSNRPGRVNAELLDQSLEELVGK